MNVGELKARLDQFPHEMQVMVTEPGSLTLVPIEDLTIWNLADDFAVPGPVENVVIFQV